MSSSSTIEEIKQVEEQTCIGKTTALVSASCTNGGLIIPCARMPRGAVYKIEIMRSVEATQSFPSFAVDLATMGTNGATGLTLVALSQGNSGKAFIYASPLGRDVKGPVGEWLYTLSRSHPDAFREATKSRWGLNVSNLSNVAESCFVIRFVGFAPPDGSYMVRVSSWIVLRRDTSNEWSTIPQATPLPAAPAAPVEATPEVATEALSEVVDKGKETVTEDGSEAPI